MLQKFIKRMNSVRVKLIIVPLLLLSVAILGLAITTYSLVKKNMIDEVQTSGFNLADQAMRRLTNNNDALATIEQEIEERLIGIGQTVITNQDVLDNEYISQLASDMGIDVINWFDDNLQVIYSAFELEVGWVAPSHNPVA